jgi:uncharacterized membrane protein
MSDIPSDGPSPTTAPSPPIAPRQWPWLKIALVASLALNLLIGGAVASRFAFHERAERLAGPVAQILPRRFLSDLPRERRKELLAVIRSYRDSFRSGREKLREASHGLAAALEAEPYDAAKAFAAVAAIEQAGQSMLADGGRLANDLIGRLTPEERKVLAQRLRDRATRKR